MARRKRLISLAMLEEGNKLLDMGVPLTKVHKTLGLTWSYQSTSDIFEADRQDLHSVTRPPWLQAEPALQNTPKGWHFEGTFPYGEWLQDKNITKG